MAAPRDQASPAPSQSVTTDRWGLRGYSSRGGKGWARGEECPTASRPRKTIGQQRGAAELADAESHVGHGAGPQDMSQGNTVAAEEGGALLTLGAGVVESVSPNLLTTPRLSMGSASESTRSLAS